MDDLFAPPGHEWHPVSPALRRLRRLLLVVVVLAVAVLLVIAGAVLGWPVVVWVLLALGWAAGTVAAWVLIGRNARWWGWAERDEDLYVKHGALYRRLVVVPYGRMQYVDVHAGPLEQAFGVASVHLHTASPGTSARIPGLPRDEAARLRDRLTALGESQAAGL